MCISQTTARNRSRTYVEYPRRPGRSYALTTTSPQPPKGRKMSGRKLRLMGLGMVATAGAGFLSLAAMLNSGYAHAEGEDIGLVLGGSGVPIPGSDYVA